MKSGILIVLMALLLLVGCAEEGDLPDTLSSTSNRSYAGTQSPGDVWTFDLNYSDSTFTGTWDNSTLADITDDVELSGTFSLLPSNFLKLVLTDATPDRATLPEDGSAFFYGYEIENLAFFVQPAGSLTGSVIIASEINSCSDILGNYNYIVAAPPSSYDPLTEEAFGIFTFSGSTGSPGISGTKYSLDCLGGPCTLDEPIVPDPVTCDGTGALTLTSAGITAARGQITPAGVFMLDRGLGNGGIFGLKEDPAVSLTDLHGTNLRGFAFFPALGIDQAVEVAFDAVNTTASARPFSNLETNSIDPANLVDITFTTNTNGRLEGFMTHNSATTTLLAGVVAKDASELILIMIGISDDISAPAFLVILGT